jgi:hypothetical protein
MSPDAIDTIYQRLKRSTIIQAIAPAFPETQEALLRYDRADYCFAPLVHEGEWAYWERPPYPKIMF